MDRPLAPYATRLAAHLAASRRLGYSFERAWKAATRVVKPDPDAHGWPMDYTRKVMRDGYMRIGTGGAVAALAEREKLFRDAPPVRPVVARRCGWGGVRCDEPADPYLCPSHAALIHAANGSLSEREMGTAVTLSGGRIPRYGAAA